MPNNHLAVYLCKEKRGWCWRMWRGGTVVAESGEYYPRKDGATRALTRFYGAVRQPWKLNQGGPGEQRPRQ